MNTLVNLLKKNSVFNKNKWTLVAISIVFFVGVYWYYKKSKENFGLILDETKEGNGLYTDSGDILLTDSEISKGILEILIIKNYTERLQSDDIRKDKFNQMFINDNTGVTDESGREVVGTLKYLQKTNLNNMPESTIDSLDNVEVNLYIGGYEDAGESDGAGGSGGGCLLSSDYKKAFEYVKQSVQDDTTSVGDSIIHMFNYKTVTCEKYNQQTGISEWMDVTDPVKQLCTNAGVGFYKLNETEPVQFEEGKTRHDLPLIEFKLSGKISDGPDSVKDFTTTSLYKDYQTHTSVDIGSGITLTELQNNIKDWLNEINAQMLTDSTFPKLVKYLELEP